MASAPAERRRPRWRRIVVALLLCGALGLGVAGGLQAHAALADSSSFRVDALEVRGLRLLTGEAVLAVSGVEVGDGLFDVDLDDVARRLERLVWVRSARVERKPPDRLVVHLEERHRTVWVDWQGLLYGIDRDGVLLPPDRLTTEGIDDLDLPVLRVRGLVEGDSVAAGMTVTDSTTLRLLAWVHEAVDRAPDLTPEISQVAALDGSALQLRLVADELEVRLPPDRVAERLAALREILARVYRDCPNPAYVDLRFEGQVVVGRRSGQGHG
jgi:cell division protein FtsQ